MSISILIPSLNSRTYLPNAISSVFLAPALKSVKIMLVDGYSVDQTLEEVFACSYFNGAQITLNSSRDLGPANALNHGFQGVTSPIIGWLNSDDLYNKGAIERAL